jgi:DNA uptake protein ComE-like DNA-binding protein/uncharacterized protein YidB (DUF937 family)
MGLIDTLQEQAISYVGKEYPQAADAIKSLITQHGGVSGVIAHFKAQGMGEIVNSWVATGKNLPISSEQIQKVLGNETLKNMAAKFGTTPEAIAQQVSQHLPTIIDKITPSGGLPTTGFMGSLVNLAKGFLGGNKTAVFFIALTLAASQAHAAKKININTATQEELESLPGVGAATAQKIMSARPLKSADDLEKISGLSDKEIKGIKKAVSFKAPKEDKDSDEKTEKKLSKKEKKALKETEESVTSKSDDVKTENVKAEKSEKKGFFTGMFSKKDKAKKAKEIAEDDEGEEDEKTIAHKLSALASGEMININRASISELEKLPGIGPIKAQRIIEARPFKSKQDVMNIRGIKEGIFKKIEGHISL